MALVSQINLVTFFAERHFIDSVMAPFVCAGCGASSIDEVAVRDVRDYRPPERRCGSCGGALELDDLPEDYFAFVEWHRADSRGAGR